MKINFLLTFANEPFFNCFRKRHHLQMQGRGDSATMIPSNTHETVLLAPKKTKKHRSKFARNPWTKQNQKNDITYDLYANAVASRAVTLNPSESDASMHRIKAQGQACKISKGSLVSALPKSQEECMAPHEEAVTVAQALESVEEKNRRLRVARAEPRHHKSALRRSDVITGEMQQQLKVVRFQNLFPG